jgi:hypothetical protein
MPRAFNPKRKFIAVPGMALLLAGLLFQLSVKNSLAEDTVNAATAVNVPVNMNPAAITTGDFNRDGKPDFAVVNRPVIAQVAQNIAIVLNAGGGNFLPAVYIPAESSSNLWVAAIKTADFNGDGKLDLVTAVLGPSITTDFVQIRLGDGMGNFAAPAEINVGFSPNNIVVADFNNDGKPDVATSNTGPGMQCHPGYAAVFVNNGSGGLTAMPNVGARAAAYDLVAGDFNGDGKQDLAVRSGGDAGCGPPFGGVVIFIGNGNGTFTRASEYEASFSPAYLDTTDLNHDGKLDLVGPNNNLLIPLLGTGAGDFVGGTTFGLSGVNSDSVAADFNLDGYPDVAAVNSSANSAVVAFGNGFGGFTSSNSFSTGTNPGSLAAADFDGNGRPDLAVTNYGSGSVTVILDVTPPAFIPTRTQFDFDGDQRADIAVYREGNTAGAPSYWHILRSLDNTYQGLQLGANGDKPVPADYNGDGKTEAAVWRPSNGTWYTSTNPATNYGAFGWGQSSDVPVPGDFDGDGKADYVVFRPLNGTWYVYESSNGGFQMQQFGTSTDKPVLGDFDGDGKTDFAYYRPGATSLANSSWNVIQSSTGSLLSAQFGRGEDKAVPADYNADRLTDIAVYRPSNQTWYTSLSPAINYGAYKWGIDGDVPAPADYDRDGKADLAVFRPGTATFYIIGSMNTHFYGQQWGVPGDRPVQTSFIP